VGSSGKSPWFLRTVKNIIIPTKYTVPIIFQRFELTEMRSPSRLHTQSTLPRIRATTNSPSTRTIRRNLPTRADGRGREKNGEVTNTFH
jgi:hypothetical protein